MIVRQALKYFHKNYYNIEKIYLQKCSSRSILLPNEDKVRCLLQRSFSMTNCYVDKDPAPYFFNEEVQSLLKNLTGMNVDKVFQNAHLEDTEQLEEYKLYTKDDLEEHMNRSMKEAERLLQMPPIVKEREPISEVLSHDPALQNPKITSKLMVADISYGASERNRIIVVRDPDGTLRKATWEERDRMNQVYNPRKGRYLEMPPVFQDENLKNALDGREYLFILDLACAQFEPDDSHFHRVTGQTYDHINETSSYGTLHSTRYYGPMCFYLAWGKKLDPLIISYINRERINEAVELIRLYYFIHEKSKYVQRSEIEDEMLFIKNYSNEYSGMKSNVLMALQSYEEMIREQEENEAALKLSHGISQSPSTEM